MRTKKRNRAAKDRERLKKQRIDPLNAASEGSQYNPSDRDSESTNQSNIVKDPARNTLYDLWEARSSDASESDGETMLGLNDSFDENDWDPEVVPDLYPIFTEAITTFKFAEKALRATVYTGKSRTTKWRRQVAQEAQAKEAASHSDIRSFFQKDTPAEGANVTISEPPAIPERPSSPESIHRLAVGLQMPADNRYQSPASLSPCPSSHPPSPLSRTSSLEPIALNLNEHLLFENELNALTLEGESDPPHIEQAHERETPVLAENADNSVENRLKELRKQLTILKKPMETKMRSGKQKVDPRDLADTQALVDYCTLAEQLVREGCRSPEMTANLQIAHTKVSTITKDGDIISKSAWYARTLRSKAKHVRDFGSLPARRQGKGAVHRSLLDNPSVSRAVNAFLDKTDIGKVSEQYQNHWIFPSGKRVGPKVP